MSVVVEPVVEASAEVRAAIHRLLPQLSSTSEPITQEHLEEIVDSPCTTLFAARLNGDLVGLLTLAIFRIPTGVRAWIEDVVVDETVRGKGVGEALNHAALQQAQRAGAKTVELTSRPSREAANRLYRRIGFEPRETNVYRYVLES